MQECRKHNKNEYELTKKRHAYIQIEVQSKDKKREGEEANPESI